MRRVTAILSAAAIAFSAVGVMAQAKPDFSGTWTLVPGEGGGGGGRGGGGGGGRGGGGGATWGMSATVKQTGAVLSVTYTTGREGAAPVTLTYNLDGKPSTNTVMGRGGEATDQTATASWSGNSLVIVTKTANGESRRTISMKDGMMVMEYNSGREGAMPVTVQYKKG
jgi:hypothetical protein